MGQVSKALGLGSSVEFQGQTYKLSPWTYAIQSEFERYLEEHSVKCVRRLQKVLPKDEYERLLKETMRDISSGIYTFGGEAVADALKSVPHLIHLTWLMIRANHPEVKQSLVQEMYEKEMETVLEAVSSANADPTISTLPEGPVPAANS